MKSRIKMNANLHELACEFLIEAAEKHYVAKEPIKKLLKHAPISTRVEGVFVHAVLPIWLKNGTQIIVFEVKIPTTPPVEPEVLHAIDIDSLDWDQVDLKGESENWGQPK